MRRTVVNILFAAIFLVPALCAQGVPASVTSLGFGGNGNRGGGPPASVTSPGFGETGMNRFRFSQSTNHQFSGTHNFRSPHHPFSNTPFGGVVYAVPVPYYVPVETVVPVDDTMEQMAPQPGPYLGGPTLFDRRGPGVSAPLPVVQESTLRPEPLKREQEVEALTAAPAPIEDRPQTMLIFKDGHHLEIQNYAIVGDMLYDMTPGHARRILLADLDLGATTKQNDDRGIDFRLPPQSQAK